MESKEFCRGRWGKVVFATGSDGVCLAEIFFAERSPSDQTKLATLFKRFSDFGQINNREKFKKIADDLFEFKSHQIRMPCFIDGRSVVVTHGCIKKRDDLNPADVKRAERIRDEYRKNTSPQKKKEVQGSKKR